MNSKYLIILLLYVLISAGCSKKDLNLPESSPMPVPIVPTAEYSFKCNVFFKSEMTFTEIAIAAVEMRQICGFAKEKIINIAHETYLALK